MWFWYLSPDKPEIANYVIVHRRDAKNAQREGQISLSVHPLESETDSEKQKGKNLTASGKSNDGP